MPRNSEPPRTVDLFAWRNAIMSEHGPPNPLARLVLLTVSLHMQADGSGAWPAQTSISKRAKVGLRSVKRHLETAERLGWIERTQERIPGKKWRRTNYEACVPAAVYDLLPERPWESDPMWKRGVTLAPRYHHSGPVPHGATVALSHDAAFGASAPNAPNEVPNATSHGATGAGRGANGDRNEVPKLGTLTLPLNSSVNSSDEGPALQTRSSGVSNSDLDDKIRKLKKAGFEPDQIVGQLSQYGTTLLDVRRAVGAGKS